MIVLYALIFLLLAALIYHLVTGRNLRSLGRRNLAPLRCRLRGHQRSGRHVHKIEDAYYSRCRTCGVAMEKPSRVADWRAISRVPQPRGATVEPDATAPDAIAGAPAEPAPVGPIIRRGEPLSEVG